jgi:hypothetical protein
MAWKLNIFTGTFDQVGSSSSGHFSYNVIPLATTVTIPQYQQMVVSDYLELDGDLIIEGELAIV